MRLKIFYESGLVHVAVILDSRFEDYSGHVDGGLVFGILDEIIWYAIVMQLRKMSMTRLVTVNYYEPLLCGTEYRAASKVIGVRNGDILALAWIEDSEGRRHVEVEGIFKEAKKLSVQDFLKNFNFTDCSLEIQNFFHSLT